MRKEEKRFPKSVLRKASRMKCIVFSSSILLTSIAVILTSSLFIALFTFVVSLCILSPIVTCCLIPRKYWGFYMRSKEHEPMSRNWNPTTDPRHPSYFSGFDSINKD